MAADAPWPRPLPEAIIPAGPGAHTLIGPDRLVVVEPAGEDGRPGEHLVSAYDLPDVRLLWRVAVPVDGPVGMTAMVGGTVLISREWNSASPPRITALTADSGAVRWQQSGWLLGVTQPAGVLLRTSPYGEPGRPDDPVTVRSVAADSGAVRWSHVFPAGAEISVRLDADRVTAVVARMLGGRVEVWDPVTGQLVRTGDVSASQGFAEVVGDLLLVHDGERSITAYGLDRLERRWSVDLNASREFPMPAPCGDALLCLTSRDGGVRVVDALTGRTRWRDPRWSFVMEAGAVLLATHHPPPDGREPLIILDPATGRPIGELGRWALLRPGLAGPLIGVRPLEPGTGRVMVAELDPDTLTVTRRGVLLDTSTECDAARHVIVCRRLDGSFGVWRLT